MSMITEQTWLNIGRDADSYSRRCFIADLCELKRPAPSASPAEKWKFFFKHWDNTMPVDAITWRCLDKLKQSIAQGKAYKAAAVVDVKELRVLGLPHSKRMPEVVERLANAALCLVDNLLFQLFRDTGIITVCTTYDHTDDKDLVVHWVSFFPKK
jgi:hypothetical protein